MELPPPPPEVVDNGSHTLPLHQKPTEYKEGIQQSTLPPKVREPSSHQVKLHLISVNFIFNFTSDRWRKK